jgi:hypothetical protein
MWVHYREHYAGALMYYFETTIQNSPLGLALGQSQRLMWVHYREHYAGALMYYFETTIRNSPLGLALRQSQR